MIPDNKLEELRNEMDNEENLMVSYLKRDEESGDIELFLQVADEIEEFFTSEETEESSQWHNSDYHDYYLKDYSNNFAEFTENRTDAFGGEYISASGEINLGLLRTVGISDGRVFKIENQYSEETLEDSVRDLKQAVKEIYKTFIGPIAIRGELTIRDI